MIARLTFKAISTNKPAWIIRQDARFSGHIKITPIELEKSLHVNVAKTVFAIIIIFNSLYLTICSNWHMARYELCIIVRQSK